MPLELKDIIKDRDPYSTYRFVALIVIGMIVPLALRFIQNGYVFFEDADVAMPLLVIATALFFYSSDEAIKGFPIVRIPFLISGIFMSTLGVALTFKSVMQIISLRLIFWQGFFGILMSLTVLLTVVLMSHRYDVSKENSKEKTSKELGDTNLIFIFLAIIPVLTTASIYVTGGAVLTYWGAAMIPSTTGFLLGGLAVLVGSIVKSTEDSTVGIVATLMMLILGYLLFIASLPFVLESKSTADYIALFETISPLYLFSLIAVLPQKRGSKSVISEIFGFNLRNNTKPR